MYRRGEPKKNFQWKAYWAFEYSLYHFCCPNGTVLDMSCDPEGTYYKDTYVDLCLYAKIYQYTTDNL